MLSLNIPSFFKIPCKHNYLNPRFLLPSFSPMAPSPKITVEYAKSGRSSCKSCEKKIPEKSMRLGLVTKHPQGFDQTKWHHLDCFPFNSDFVSSPENITGFASLLSKDQEALEKLINKEIATLQKLSATDEEPELEIAISTSDVKSTYKDAKLLPKWRAFQTVIYLEKDDGLHASSKIAAFDFDGCLAKTSVKVVGADAWSLMYPSIPEKLQSLYHDGYKLVIFTNESNIERWKKSRQAAVDSKIGRLEQFIKLAGVPIQVFIACGLSNSKPEDPFRKPKTGMWNIMKKQFNSGLPISMDESFYVGDAAGRRGDHSDADIRFAQAIGLRFYVPEEFFGK